MRGANGVYGQLSNTLSKETSNRDEEDTRRDHGLGVPFNPYLGSKRKGPVKTGVNIFFHNLGVNHCLVGPPLQLPNKDLRIIFPSSKTLDVIESSDLYTYVSKSFR